MPNGADVVERVVCRRPWWRRFPIRAEVVPAYLIGVAAIVLGLSAQYRLINTNRDQIERLCIATREDRRGIRTFLIQLSATNPNPERAAEIIELMEMHIPDERVCE